MSTRRWAGLFLALTLTACGGGTDVATQASIAIGPSSTTTAGEASTTSTAAPRPTVRATTSSTATPVVEQVTEVSPLSRKDVPPGGVADQFTTGTLAALEACAPVTESRHVGTIQIGGSVRLCLEGRANDGWTWQLRLPSGRTQSLESSDWTTGVGDQLGSYEMTGRRGSDQVTVGFEVALRSKPTMLRSDPDRAPAGATFVVALGGVPGGQHGAARSLPVRAPGRIKPDIPVRDRP